MKGGRPTWTARIGKERLETLQAAVRLGVRTQHEVYEAYQLGAVIGYAAFQRWATRVRRDAKARRSAGDAGPDYASQFSALSPEEQRETVLRAAMAGMHAAMVEGGARPNAWPDFVRSAVKLNELSLREEVEQRAAELHELKLAELRKRQEAALETISSTNQLTPEQVAEIRLRVLGL